MTGSAPVRSSERNVRPARSGRPIASKNPSVTMRTSAVGSRERIASVGKRRRAVVEASRRLPVGHRRREAGVRDAAFLLQPIEQPFVKGHPRRRAGIAGRRQRDLERQCLPRSRSPDRPARASQTIAAADRRRRAAPSSAPVRRRRAGSASAATPRRRRRGAIRQGCRQTPGSDRRTASARRTGSRISGSSRQ